MFAVSGTFCAAGAPANGAARARGPAVSSPPPCAARSRRSDVSLSSRVRLSRAFLAPRGRVAGRESLRATALWARVAPEMQARFHAAHPAPPASTTGTTQVAVHVRRGDTVLQRHRHMGDAMLRYFNRTISMLRARYHGTARPARASRPTRGDRSWRRWRGSFDRGVENERRGGRAGIAAGLPWKN